VDDASRAAIAFDIVSRGYAFYVTLTATILMLIGMELGVWKSTSTDPGLFGVTLVILLYFS
jgi:hypothetical protein